MDVDEIITGTLGAVGLIVLAIGLVLFFLPDIAIGMSAPIIAANVAAVLALILAFWTARERYRSAPNQTPVADVERPVSTPAPGQEIDRLIHRLTRERQGRIEYREQIREAIGEIAVGVLMQRDKSSREEAMDRLREGTWTDDQVAVNYFTGGVAKSELSLFGQLRERFFGLETEFERQLRRTVAAIEEEARAFSEDIAEVPGRTGTETFSRVPSNAGLMADGAGTRVTEQARYRDVIETFQWKGLSAFALATVALGLIISKPPLLMAGAVAAGAAGYSRALGEPELATLEVTRTLSESSPEPGEDVEVTVTVENTGSAFLTDLRLIDHVPPTVRVIEGSPRHGTALQPGQTATFSYDVIAERGRHEWALQVIGRDISGARELEAYIDPSSETVLECLPSLRSVIETPVRMQTSIYSGQVNTEVGGEGLEFFSLRDYLPGDPKRRINWKKFARTGEFTTIEFRQERAARVVLLFDTREASYVSRAPGERHAVESSVDAAYDVFSSVFDEGHLVGIAAFDTVPCWLAPGSGDGHRERARQLFVDHPALSPLPPQLLEKEGKYIDPMTHVRRRLPANTQIFLFSPLTDQYAYEVARRLDGAGHLVTVFSPDPTTDRTTGQRMARLERTLRVLQLREHGVRVVDWDPDDPLRLEIERVSRRWGA